MTRARLDLDVLDVRYEELVADPPGTIRARDGICRPCD